MNPKASILIITYNQERTVGDAIESILAQRCDFPYEIIIGEDASTDGTRAVCERYAAEYPDMIRLMPATPNKGIVGNWFDCLEAARGEYVADCAGDDSWADARRLQRQCEYLDAHPDDVAVISDWEIVRGDVAVNTRDIPAFGFCRMRKEPALFLRDVLGSRGYFPLLSAMLLRRKVLTDIMAADAARLRRDDWGCEDLPVVAALANAGYIGYLPLKAARYNAGDESSTNTVNPAKLFDFYIKALRCAGELCEIYAVSPLEIKGPLQDRINYLASLALQCDDAARGAQLTDVCKKLSGIPSLKSRIYLRAMPRRWSRKALAAVKKLF